MSTHWLKTGFAALAFIASITTSATPFIKTNHGGDDAVRLLYEYPKGTWIENIAIRESGQLLLTILTEPHVDSLDPFSSNAPKPETLFTLPLSIGATGIAEIRPDVFAIAAGNFSLSSGPTSGSWKIFQATFSPNRKPVLEKLADLPELTFANGLCALPSGDILVGDIRTGKVWHVDSRTGGREVVIDDEYTAAVSDPVFGSSGVNGIHVKDGELYFTNTVKRIFAKVLIHPDGRVAGNTHIISRTPGTSPPFYYDDFAIQDGFAYQSTGGGNSIERVRIDASGKPKSMIIAGNLNSTEIAEPTSSAFGRTAKDKHILYVVTSGGMATPVNGTVSVGAQVLAIDTRKCGWSE